MSALMSCGVRASRWGSSFPEWTSVPFGFGSAGPLPDPNTPNQPNTIEVSGEHFHPGQGKFAAKLTISDTADNTAGIGPASCKAGAAQPGILQCLVLSSAERLRRFLLGDHEVSLPHCA